jgi:cytochrome P450
LCEIKRDCELYCLLFGFGKRHIAEMIHEHQAEEKAERHDLLSQFLEANDNNFDLTALTESELIID